MIELTEFANRLTPSDRLIVEDIEKNELFRGYAAMVQYGGLEAEWRVKSFGLKTDIFKRDKRRTGNYDNNVKLTGPLEMETTSNFSFADLEMMIYTRVIVERKKLNKNKKQNEQLSLFDIGMEK